MATASSCPRLLLIQPKSNWTITKTFLTFEFSALNYINHERTYYRYQLEGIDPQWMSTFAGRQGNATVGKGLLQAVYTNLPPGDYTFKVMASDILFSGTAK